MSNQLHIMTSEDTFRVKMLTYMFRKRAFRAIFSIYQYVCVLESETSLFLMSVTREYFLVVTQVTSIGNCFDKYQ